MILALINPREKQLDNIDLYLEPLICEVVDLWKGAAVVDVTQTSGKFFKL